MTHPKNTYTLVADIGGTNTRVALADGAHVLPQTIRRFANAEYPGLEPILQQYLHDEGNVDPVATCVAVAGPVQDGKARMTNLDWTMDLTTLAQATKAETVAILNDLQAQGYAVGHVADENLIHVVEGQAAKPEAAKLVVGIGTGFNAAPVFETASGRIVPASESGHATLPTISPEDAELSQFVAQTHGFPAIEDVLSGRGLENVYRFVTMKSGTEKKFKANEIMTLCGEGDPVATQSVFTCIRMLGAVCGNLALTILPFGGIYLVGGVARAFAPYFEAAQFGAAFCEKGRFDHFMQSFAVSIVTDDYAALTGCAALIATEKVH